MVFSLVAGPIYIPTNSLGVPSFQKKLRKILERTQEGKKLTSKIWSPLLS